MHVFTHLKKESVGKTGLGIYADGMVEHDAMVGQLLDEAEEARHRRQHDRHVFHRQRLGVLLLARRRHDDVPRREDHAMGGRLPRPDGLIRWPGVIKPGTVINEIGSHEDMLPTLLAAAGDADIKESC